MTRQKARAKTGDAIEPPREARTVPAKTVAKVSTNRRRKTEASASGEPRRTNGAARGSARENNAAGRARHFAAADDDFEENVAARGSRASIENCECAGAAYYSMFLSVLAKYIGCFDAARRGRAFAGDRRGFEHIAEIATGAIAASRRGASME
jgi:hypothetical protein